MNEKGGITCILSTEQEYIRMYHLHLIQPLLLCSADIEYTLYNLLILHGKGNSSQGGVI